MRRLAVLGAVALMGVVFAVFLMQRPDTGGDVVVAQRDRPQPVVYVPPPDDGPQGRLMDDGSPDPSPNRPVANDEITMEGDDQPATKKSADGLVWNEGPNPRAAALQERQQTPEALTSGKAAIPWTLIRRNLLRMDDENARSLGSKANQMMLDLRRNRRDPEMYEWDDLESRQQALVDEIRSSPYMDDSEVAQMVDRVEEILGEYEE